MLDLPFADRIVRTGDRDAWHAFRRSSLGGSSAPTIAGLNPYQLRDELWAVMVGDLPADDLSDNEAVYWGTRLEPVLLEEVAAKRRLIVHSWSQSDVVRHADHDGIHDTPDGIAIDDDGYLLVQIKTTSAWKADDWRDEPPPEVYTQVQHELEVLDLERAIVGVLIGGQSFRTFDVVRDREVGTWLVARCLEFLGWIRDRVPPPHDSRHPMTVGLAKRLNPNPERKIVALDPGFVAIDARRTALDQNLKAAKEERDQINERIRRALGDANCGQLVNGVRYSITANGAMRRSE